MRARVSPFACGVVFTVGLFVLVQSESATDQTVGAIVALLALGLAIRAERRIETELGELAEYRREQVAYERCAERIEALIEQEAAALNLN